MQIIKESNHQLIAYGENFMQSIIFQVPDVMNIIYTYCYIKVIKLHDCEVILDRIAQDNQNNTDNANENMDGKCCVISQIFYIVQLFE